MPSDKPELENQESAERTEKAQEPQPTSLPIVGIGASAGGLEAVSELLRHLPADTGMGFVLVQHLDPQHASALTEILSKATSMKVSEVTHGVEVAPNRVYVIPPNANMVVRSGVLELTPRRETRGQHMPVDCFFASLAKDLGSQAVAVILSGTASDGALGICAVKAEGGITFAQDETAKYDGMPRAAIGTGHVDFVLPPERIASELVKISRHPYVANHQALRTGETPKDREDELKTIYLLLRKESGVDFTLYKEGTLKRRIERRMALHKMQELKDYVSCLQGDSEEVEALFQDILISVTGFFRDPETFDTLKSDIFPALMKNRPLDEPIRVWVPGCSTGEEAYSVAICLLEFFGDTGTSTPIKIFATDISEAAVNTARSAVYPENISADLSPDRLRRFFVKTESGYQVSKTIRDSCVFAKQDVTKDPPFSQLDFISCRNVLIYFGPVLQKRVIPILHYALKKTGYLMLGSSETIGQFSDLFTLVDKKNKIYSKEPVPSRMTFDFPLGTHAAEELIVVDAAEETSGSVVDIQKEADRVVVGKYAPPGVVINKDREILQFRGETGDYLKPAPGAPSFDVLKMAREGLLLELRLAIDEAVEHSVSVRKENLRVKTNEHFTRVCLEVIPLRLRHGGKTCLLINFEEGDRRPSTKAKSREKTQPWSWFQSFLRKGKAAPRKDEIAEGGRLATDRGAEGLREELEETKQYLQSVIEEHDAKNEELKAANEEILSSNEELQSTNEELETAKEELQATNEELTTVNEELQNRNVEMAKVNDDLTNLLSSVNIPILMLGPDLKIRRFTPSAAKILSLIPGDIGRPIADIKPKINVPELDQWILEVVETLTLREEEVQDGEGHWYTMCLRPYRTMDNKIEGAVISLVDIDAIKRSQDDIRYSEVRIRAILETAAEGIITIDERGMVDSFNRAAEEMFGYSAEEVTGQNVKMLMPEPYHSEHDGYLDRYLNTGEKKIIGIGREVEGRRKDASTFPMQLSVSEVDLGTRKLFTGVLRDVGDLKESQEKLLQSARLSAVGEAVTGLIHESRNALQRSQAAIERLERRLRDKQDQDVSQIINELQTAQDDLHRHYEDVRAYASSIRLKKERCDLSQIVTEAWENLKPIRKGRKADLQQDPGGLDVHCAVDPLQLRAVIQNVLENSLTASDEAEKPVEIRVRYSTGEIADAPALSIALLDNGPGLTPEARERIFDAFYTTKTHGTGLGMAIARRIVEAHGGKIRVGTGKGTGAEIVITLPWGTK